MNFNETSEPFKNRSWSNHRVYFASISTWKGVWIKRISREKREHPIFPRKTSSSNLLEDGGIFLIVLGRESRCAVGRIAKRACIVTIFWACQTGVWHSAGSRRRMHRGSLAWQTKQVTFHFGKKIRQTPKLRLLGSTISVFIHYCVLITKWRTEDRWMVLMQTKKKEFWCKHLYKIQTASHTVRQCVCGPVSLSKMPLKLGCPSGSLNIGENGIPVYRGRLWTPPLLTRCGLNKHLLTPLGREQEKGHIDTHTHRPTHFPLCRHTPMIS